MTRIQQILGEHFAPAQGGSGFASQAVARAVQWLAAGADERGAAVGQSSWGPTGFVILPSQERAEALLGAAQVARASEAMDLDPALSLHIVRGRNHGARVEQSVARKRAG